MAQAVRTNREAHVAKGLRVRDRIRSWVETELAPTLGLAPNRFEMKLPPAGEHSQVFILCGPGSRTVVRLFEKRSDRVRTLRAQRHCRRRGVRVPRVVAVYSSPRVRRRLGHFVLVEECVGGEHPHEMNDRERALRVIGTGLARVGGMTRRRWGNLMWGRRRGYFADLQRDAIKQLRRLQAVDWEPARDLAPRLTDWLEGYREPISAIRIFGLGHRAVIGSNLLVTEDDDLCLIDFQRIRYEAFPSMLVRALSCVCRDEIERECMLEHYFSATTIRTREEFDRLSPPFEALWLLKLIRSGVNDARLGRVADVAPEWIDRLRALLEVQPVG